MAKGSKTARKQSDRAEKQVSKPTSDDPLSAFPADPPKQNMLLLIGSALLFAIWFCYLAYVALRS